MGRALGGERVRALDTELPYYPQSKHGMRYHKANPLSLSPALVGTAARVKEELCPHVFYNSGPLI